MKLYALSDLHLACPINRDALRRLAPCPDDWLIIAGDIGERIEHFYFAFETLRERFRTIVWAPGNHDLWCLPDDPKSRRGEAKYRALVSICRQFGVITPEDPYPRFCDGSREYLIAPLLLLYDYSFRPPGIPPERAVQWAADQQTVCADELLLSYEPHLSIPDWCQQRCQATARRLRRAAASHPLILINHYPLRYEHARLLRAPRFSLWCGTEHTEDWHARFNVSVVVYGHMHIRSTRWINGTRFEEVSLGYPRQWSQAKGIEHYLRLILPGAMPQSSHAG